MDRGGSPREVSRNNGTEGFEAAALEIGVGGGWRAFVGSSQTVQTILFESKGKGPQYEIDELRTPTFSRGSDKQRVFCPIGCRLQ